MKHLYTLLLVGLTFNSFAQVPQSNKKTGGWNFTPVKVMEPTPVDNQNLTNTCWSFSTMSFLESEMKRINKPIVNLAEMFIVDKCYPDKADLYVRMHGNSTFAAGGNFDDILYVWKKYGLVPEAVYPGKLAQSKHEQLELERVSEAYMKALITAPNKGKISPYWKKSFQGMIDGYLGIAPVEFAYMGKSYTPKTFANSIGLNPDDYVQIGSYSHHPFYSKFALEIPDNWLHHELYNVQISDLADILDNALSNGYTIAWGADVSEKGFSNKNGLAIVPEKPWEEMKSEEIDALWEKPFKQRIITQDARQLEFDNYQTQDDHGMHIVGLYKDDLGQKFYLVKNSWGVETNDAGGYFFASESYILLKTTSILINKAALPSGVINKLELK